jgi:hypothetical protein
MANHLNTCIACGDLFEELALWQTEGSPPPKCPACRVMTFIREPGPEFLSPPASIESDSKAGSATPTELLIRSQKTARWVVRFIAAIFVTACFLPAVTIWSDLPPPNGLWCLVFGVVSCSPWLANPLLLYGSISLLRGRNRTGLIFGLLACVCTVPVLVYMTVEGGFSRMHVGYFLWQANFFVFSLAAFGLTIHYGENPGRSEPEEDNKSVGIDSDE